MTFYRIQPGDRDVAGLLDELNWWSTNWNDPWAEPRYGVSVCASVEDLVGYFRAAGGWVDETCVLVELDGYYSGQVDEDHQHGALLVCPTEVISVTYLPTEVIDLIYG